MSAHAPVDIAIVHAVESAATATGVPAELLFAVAWVESRFTPCTRSGAGAVGLFQLMPRIAVQLGVRDRCDPRQSALGGARYLRQLYRGSPRNIAQPSLSWRRALARYCWGSGNVARSGGRWPAAVRKYVNRVFTVWSK